MLKIPLKAPEIQTLHYMLRWKYNEMCLGVQIEEMHNIELAYKTSQIAELGKKTMMEIFRGGNAKGIYNMKFTEPELFLMLTINFNNENGSYIPMLHQRIKDIAHKHFTDLIFNPIMDNETF